jgi:predicted kinase
MTAVPFVGKLILTIGLPGSGKSWWAAEQVERDPSIVRVERDVARLFVTGSMRDHSQEILVTNLCRSTIEEALRSGKTVIVSDTNLKPRYRNELYGLAGKCGSQIQEVSFLHVPLATCIERDALRSDPVGAEVIGQMHKYLLDSHQLSR